MSRRVLKILIERLEWMEAGSKVDDLTRPKSSLNCQIMKIEGNVEASDQIQRLEEGLFR
jgi:hypothetical protein